MKHPSKPIPAKLMSRLNRFLGIVDHKGKKVQCFIPNPGRMHELLIPGSNVYLIHRPGEHRKTSYDLTIVEYNDFLISIDSRLPNYMLREAIDDNILPEFSGYNFERFEPTFHNSRLDLKLCDGRHQILIEAKSCTLVEDNIALFPDAPTKRGARHMNTLIRAMEHGRAAVCFIVQRLDANEWRPNARMDPEFSQSVRNAVQNGVEIYAYTCDINLIEVKIARRIPVNLE